MYVSRGFGIGPRTELVIINGRQLCVSGTPPETEKPNDNKFGGPAALQFIARPSPAEISVSNPVLA